VLLQEHYFNEISIENFKAYFAIILIVTGLYITYKNSIIKEKSAKESKSTSFDLLFYVDPLLRELSQAFLA
jgi:transposase